MERTRLVVTRYRRGLVAVKPLGPGRGYERLYGPVPEKVVYLTQPVPLGGNREAVRKGGSGLVSLESERPRRTASRRARDDRRARAAKHERARQRRIAKGRPAR